MAGEGSRFKNSKWNMPKPLIELRGVPLFVRALNSVKISGITLKYSFIVRYEHIIDYQIDQFIKRQIPTANIFSVKQTTKGAVETCMFAKDAIDNNDAVLVLDCDLEFRSNSYIEGIKASLRQSGNDASGGGLVSFKSDLPKYSYAKTDLFGNVIETAEKKAISNDALCGAYFFASGKEFKIIAEDLLKTNLSLKQSEYYISILYNYLIKQQKPVKLAFVDEYYSYGTPEELNQYI